MTTSGEYGKEGTTASEEKELELEQDHEDLRVTGEPVGQLYFYILINPYFC